MSHHVWHNNHTLSWWNVIGCNSCLVNNNNSNNSNNNSNTYDDIYGAVNVAQSHCESSLDRCTLSTRWLPTLRPSQTTRLLLCTSTIAILLLLNQSWYSFYRPAEGGRLSQPGHCSKGAQPMPKAVYRSGCHEKHNCQWSDSNLRPLMLQSDMLTTWPLRPYWWLHRTLKKHNLFYFSGSELVS